MSLQKLATSRTTSLSSHLIEAQCEAWTTDPGQSHHEPTSYYIATCQPTPDTCMRDVPPLNGSRLKDCYSECGFSWLR